MKRTLAIVTLAVVALMTAAGAIAQQRPQSQAAPHRQRQGHPQPPPQVQPIHPLYQGTWYELLLKKFNPDHFDYGGSLTATHNHRSCAATFQPVSSMPFTMLRRAASRRACQVASPRRATRSTARQMVLRFTRN